MFVVVIGVGKYMIKWCGKQVHEQRESRVAIKGSNIGVMNIVENGRAS